MKNLNSFINEGVEYNKTDEDFFLFSLYCVCDGGMANVKVEDKEINVEVPKEDKKTILDICKREKFEVVSAKACGKGWAKIVIKRDPSRQIEKYNLDQK